MALRVLLLLASHTAASATLLPPRHVLNFRGVASDVESSGEDKSRLGLHFRGGAEDDESSGEDTDSTAPLTREQIVAKLNEVPTFTLIGEEQGGFVALKLADSEKNTICFFTDPEEAKTVLEMMQSASEATACPEHSIWGLQLQPSGISVRRIVALTQYL